ncbi:alpha-L-fucosidase [Caldanaerobius fijiensis DSM 17918]|uniref:alpha-L-fucosidase n=1 Tax=Caldanaerobius fijiensis DSM 17918 TaxID=1121256 RepID=A0A1M5DBC3_9THEO|nr:alpha-L-fucosidase [Caldanaerobius fijiensis]SHF64154.1 alpha-L-fucosidase [Caldanaerobius fijiensis DSM 17918]
MSTNREKRTKWFMEARFGMFIHWGLYAIPARGEWVRSHEKMSIEEYQPFFEEFNPVNYEPHKWAKAAKEAGMQYAVMTTKHHDGFCLFDSKLTDYKATNTPAGRDLIKEYVEAFRKEGLRVGFYYSLLDWHHDDYPAYGDRHHPMRDNEAYRYKKHDFSKYVDYLHGQVRELLTNYGKIDIIWFDFSYDDKVGETWRATELVKMVRSLQPDIIIDNRLGGNIKSVNPEIYAGDFASPEQIIPPEGILDEAGNPIPWEACITMNNHWGYCADDKDFKTPKQLIRALVECVSKGGNLLLNVGPDAKGEIPEESLQILSEIGKWMRKNGDSIYGCGRAELPKPEWGRYTKKGNKLYVHIFDRGIGPISLKGLKGKIKKARLLSDGSEVNVNEPWNATEYKDYAFINFAGSRLPDDIDTVVELELKN